MIERKDQLAENIYGGFMATVVALSLIGAPVSVAIDIGIKIETIRIEAHISSHAIYIDTKKHGECHIGVHSFYPEPHIFCNDGTRLP